MKTETALEFIASINKADTDKMFNLMSDNQIFIDSQNNKIKGNENVKQCWTRYFETFPDYKIEVNEILEKNPLICILGYASGTYTGRESPDNSNHWRIPAAWSAIIEDSRIKQWQVYADNILVMEIINKTN